MEHSKIVPLVIAVIVTAAAVTSVSFIMFKGGGIEEKQKIVKIEEIVPTKTPKQLSKDLLPPKYPWKALKGDESSRMFYPSYMPRKPGIEFRVNRSVLLSWTVPVSVPLVDGDRVSVGSELNIYSLDSNGEILWSGAVLFLFVVGNVYTC